ncbi:hypothetical protein ACYZT3_13880 [Pseudomonas sp. MDT1-16]
MDSQTNNNVLKLYPVILPGWKTPVIHDSNPDGGIPLSLFDEHLEGLLCLIDPWLNAASKSVVMAVDDRIDLFVDGRETPVTGKTIGRDEENDRVRLYIPKGILHDGVNDIFYQVLRVGQTTPEESLKLKVLYHTLAPGEPGHSARKVQVSADVQTKGVDKAQAERGVVVGFDYPNRRAHDDIRLTVGTTYVDKKITPGEAIPGNPVVTNTLFTPTFEKTGDKPRTPFWYTVTDQLGNSSGPSESIEVDVHLKEEQLDLKPAKVLEAKEQNGTVLNFEKDFYEATSATVEVAFTGSARGQTVKVYWLGRNSTYGSEIQTVSAAGQTLKFLVPRLEVVDCIGTGAQVSYTVRLPGTSEDLMSKDLRITITGQKHRLPEPTLNSSKDNLRAYYPTLEGTYSVRMALFGVVTRYGDEVTITQSSYTDIPVPSTWLTENRGKGVMFNYTLKKRGTAEPIIFSWCLRVKL